MPINWDAFQAQQNTQTGPRTVGNAASSNSGAGIGDLLSGLASLSTAINTHNTDKLVPQAVLPQPSLQDPTYRQPNLGLTGTPDTSRVGDYLQGAISGADSVYGAGTPMSQIAAAQAILESRLNGKPSDLAAKYNNYFGIKGQGTAGSAAMPTQEYIGGKMRGTKAAFAANKTAEDSFNQHKNLMNNPRYAAVLAAKTPEEAAVALQKAGYATDPNYAKSLINVLNTYVRPNKSTKTNNGQLKSASNSPIEKYIDTRTVNPPSIPQNVYEDVIRRADHGADLALNSRQVLPYGEIPRAYNPHTPAMDLSPEDIDSIMRNLANPNGPGLTG